MMWSVGRSLEQQKKGQLSGGQEWAVTSGEMLREGLGEKVMLKQCLREEQAVWHLDASRPGSRSKVQRSCGKPN